MINKFKPEELTDYDDQKGANITLEIDGNESVFSVWIDVLDEGNTTLRVIQDFEEDILTYTVEPEDFKIPEVTYSDDKAYCYITFNGHSVHIKLDDECVVFDVWDSSDEDGAVDSTYIDYNKLIDEDDL
tara:strand:+ start:829 stop:1215 length:387 start_codon:yes stop_codon:yes gene_type:complete